MDMCAILRMSAHHLLPTKETKSDNKTVKKSATLNSALLRTGSNISRTDQIIVSPISFEKSDRNCFSRNMRYKY